MKLKFKMILVAALATLIVLPAVAQHNHKHPHVKKKAVVKKRVTTAHKGNMLQAVNVMKRTNKVILVANKAVKKNKNYTGHLAKAVHHQRYAKVLLKQHKAHRAMQHSRLARKHAMVAIRNNKGKVNRDWEFNKEETTASGETIADADLESELKTNNPSIAFDDTKVTDEELTELEVLDMDPADYTNE